MTTSGARATLLTLQFAAAVVAVLTLAVTASDLPTRTKGRLQGRNDVVVRAGLALICAGGAWPTRHFRLGVDDNDVPLFPVGCVGSTVTVEVGSKVGRVLSVLVPKAEEDPCPAVTVAAEELDPEKAEDGFLPAVRSRF